MSVRRNIVVVMCHGLRSDAVSDSNAWPLTTPGLVKLGQQGLRLVASSACPADWGGMTSLLTGLHARQHGCVEQSETAPACEGFPAWLRAAGYHVAGVGCVGMIEPFLHESILVDDVEARQPAGCAYLSAMRSKGVLPALEQQRRQRLRYGIFEPDRLLLDPEDDIDGFILAESRKLLSRLPTDRPWALIVMFSGPGNDLPPPTLYSQVVDPLTLEDGFLPADLTRVDARVELDYPRVLLQRLDAHRIGRIRADYLGRVSLLDFGIGRLQSQIGSRPDRQRTWMVVCGDRGQLLGEHGLVGHRSFLCGAVETPFIVAPPETLPEKSLQARPTKATPPGGVPPFDASAGLISTVDVAATIAAIAGCDAPKAMVGRSVLPILAGESFQSITGGLGDGGLISESARRLMLETERYKVIFDTETRDAVALYDLLNDADEDQDLVTSPIGQNVLDSLRWRLGDALLPLRALPRQ